MLHLPSSRGNSLELSLLQKYGTVHIRNKNKLSMRLEFTSLASGKPGSTYQRLYQLSHKNMDDITQVQTPSQSFNKLKKKKKKKKK